MTETETPSIPAGITMISALTLVTADMAAAVAFYRALGMTLRHGGEQARFTSLQTGNCYVNLVAQKDGQPGFWGRAIFYVDDVDRLYRQIRAAGYPTLTTPEDAPWGERYFHVRDPSGHELSFAKPLA